MNAKSDEQALLLLGPKKSNAGLVLVAALLGVLVVSGLGQANSPATPGQQVRAVSPHDKVLTDMGLRSPVHAVHVDAQCARFFTGQLRAVLANTPCRSIRRAVFVGIDPHGNRAAVSIAWVELPDSASARTLSTLYKNGQGWVAVWDAPHLHAPPIAPATACRGAAARGTLATLTAATPLPGEARDRPTAAAGRLADLPPP